MIAIQKPELKIHSEGMRQALMRLLIQKFPNLSIRVRFTDGRFKVVYNENGNPQEAKALETWMEENKKSRIQGEPA